MLKKLIKKFKFEHYTDIQNLNFLLKLSKFWENEFFFIELFDAP